MKEETIARYPGYIYAEEEITQTRRAITLICKIKYSGLIKLL